MRWKNTVEAIYGEYEWLNLGRPCPSPSCSLLRDFATSSEQVDENTGMSAQVIIESPDEKKQPRIEVRDEKGNGGRRSCSATWSTRSRRSTGCRA